MRLFALVFVVLLSAACGTPPTTPSSTNTTPFYVAEAFSGNLIAGGESYYSFVVSQSGTVNVMLATTTSDTGVPLSRQLKLSLGTPSTDACVVNTFSVNVTAALVSQLSNTMTAGTYCVDIADPGTLGPADSVNFNIRIVHP